MDTITTTRRPRFQRITPSPIHLTERDLAILKLVYEYRFSTSDMIREAIAGSPQRITRRLTDLYHSRHLDRPRDQLPSYQEGGKPIIYALGNKGADALTIYAGIDRKRIDWTTKNREAGERHIQHALMVARFRHALTLALRDRPETAIASWEHAGVFRVPVTYEDRKGKEITISIIPDACFTIRDKDDFMYFFLEADQSTMSHDRFLKKLKSYYHFFATEIYKQPDNPYHLPSFRVLTLTKSEQRKDNLRALARQVNDRQKALNLFWFACEKPYTKNPAAIFTHWQTPQDETPHHLLE
jgi:hypothetical protein